MNNQYKLQVNLLIHIIPSVYEIKDFAIHGGTAINLFHKNMPRYSVDIDLTYIPIKSREESIKTINEHLSKLKLKIEKTIPGVKVTHKTDILKLICEQKGALVKIEINGTKRGIIGETQVMELCPKAQEIFKMSCVARVVSYSQLYGGKIAAALSRQHPRDLFDYREMKENIETVKDGFILCLLGSDKPIIESLQPNFIDQKEALKNQFEGMTDTRFTYEDYENSRKDLLKEVTNCLSYNDKQFLLSFEQGSPDWSKSPAGDLSLYPSVKWKLQNIEKLKRSKPIKFNEGVEKLKTYLFPSKKIYKKRGRRL